MNFLKIISVTCTAAFLFCSALFSQAGWVTESSGTTEHLQSVYFFNDLTGWAVGYSGKIVKTTNGGTNWVAQTSSTANDLLSVYFVNALSGWAVGGSGDIIATGNGGSSWILQTTGSTTALNSVYFFNSSTGWAVGESNVILKTTNSGTNWITLFGGSVSLKSVFFISAVVGYIAGASGYILKTINGGTNWSLSNSNVSYDLYSIHFPAGSTTTGFAVGMGSPSPPILKSTDSGINWTIQTVPVGNALTSVFFANVSTGWAAGWLGTIMFSTNSGANWSNQSSFTSNTLRSIYFVNALTGWAVGDLGTILKTTTSGIFLKLEPISSLIPEHFSLEQNYPNPFNPTTKISFSVPLSKGGDRGLSAQLKIYDILGREISTLVNEQLQAGTYEVLWDASNFASGIYYYKLETDPLSGSGQNYAETKRMVLMK